jgi:hypothetical protein
MMNAGKFKVSVLTTEDLLWEQFLNYSDKTP